MTMMMFLWLPLLLLVPLLLWRPGHGASPHDGWHEPPAYRPPQPTPIEIARLRLAKGEISPVEYEEIRRTLGA